MRLGTATALGLMILALLATACGGSNARPHDMSEEEHLAMAAQQERIDRRHEVLGAQTLSRDQTGDTQYLAHDGIARLPARHAQAHQEAARALAAEHSTACGDATEERMTSCPLTAANAVEVDALPDGVRILLDTDDVEAVRAQVSCHTAHAAYVGYADMDQCPFYVRDATVEVEAAPEGGTAIRITSEDPDIAEDIRTRVFGPAPAT